jgi:uroporphyrinogen-III synthase
MQQKASLLASCFSQKRPVAIALGVDAEELVSAGVDPSAILIPESPTPQGIVTLLDSLIPAESRSNIRILCPVPKVVGLTEPPVVPDFLDSLDSLGLQSVDRLDAYVTKWTGLTLENEHAIRLLQTGKISVIAISSTAEVEGLQLLLLASSEDGTTLDCLKSVKVAAHGPVTARGARALGLPVHAISEDSSSFAGMVGAVWRCRQDQS